MSVTLVTGAASGIGRATAELLLARGGRVVATDRNEAGLAWTTAYDGVVAVVGDVTSETDNTATVAVAVERFGGLDGLFLNAGAAASGPIETVDLAVLDAVLDVNLRSVVLGLRAGLPALRLPVAGRSSRRPRSPGSAGSRTAGPTRRRKRPPSTWSAPSPSTSEQRGSGSTQSAPGRSRPA